MGHSGDPGLLVILPLAVVAVVMLVAFGPVVSLAICLGALGGLQVAKYVKNRRQEEGENVA